MKERAIVIFELEEKEEREKKNRAEVMELTAGRDGEHLRGVFQAPTKWVMRIFICNRNKRVSNIGIIF